MGKIGSIFRYDESGIGNKAQMKKLTTCMDLNLTEDAKAQRQTH